MVEGDSSQSMSKGICVLPVTGRQLRKDFLDLPLSIYRDDPNWIAPLRQTEAKRLNRRRHPFFEHGEAEFWVAYKKGRPVGRISAQLNYLHLERFNDATGHFGMIEAIDDQRVFDGLLGAAAGWLRERGLRRIAGPFCLSINEESGLLVEGFDSPPAIMSNHAHPYYGQRLEAAGFDKLKDMFSFRFILTKDLSQNWKKLVERTKKYEEIDVTASERPFMNKDFADAIGIFNDAWSENWWFLPFTDAEAQDIAHDLKPFTPPEFIQFGLVNGARNSIAVAMPDLNQAALGLNGRLLPFGWIPFLWRAKVRGLKQARLPLLGVCKMHQSKPIAAALSIALIDSIRTAAKKLGFETAELGWVLEDNHVLLKIIEKVGGEHYKTYRIYSRDIGG